LARKILKMSENKERLNQIITEFSEAIDPAINKFLVLDVDKKFQPAVRYQMSTGGKRLRPSLAVISCRLLGGKLKDVVYPAAGLEILHNYTLIVDDMIDNSVLRRGRPTTWSAFGNSIAQCVGIDYAATIFQSASTSKNPILISQLFAKTLKRLVEGEILDILFERSGRDDEPYVVKNRFPKISEKDYFEMISKKTAALFQTSCEIGGICAGATEKEVEALRKYGFNLGMIFQITDDILDIFGTEKKFQKKIGKDIEERKEGNIVILRALAELGPTDKNNLSGIMRQNQIGEKDVRQAIKLIKKTESRQKAYSLARNFAGKAKEALKTLPQNKWNGNLNSFVDFILEREK